jgi:hypothetical protein
LGLAHCQSRQPQAISFHFNIVLAILSIIKALHWLPMQQYARTPFSVSDIKAQYSNEILLDKLISIYGKDPYTGKNNPQIKRLYDLGRMDLFGGSSNGCKRQILHCTSLIPLFDSKSGTPSRLSRDAYVLLRI